VNRQPEKTQQDYGPLALIGDLLRLNPKMAQQKPEGA
jgi:hypothetical protein